MLRPRDAIIQYRAEHPDSVGPFEQPDRGAGQTIALIDAMPDLATDELVGASIELADDAADCASDPHATFAASVLVGRRHGLLPCARLLVAPVMAAALAQVPDRITAAIEWATERGAQVVLIPLGDHREHAPIVAAIRAARARGVMIVAAAGNAHPYPLLFPARMAEVVAVGACDERGRLLEDCCRSPGLDLVMPAVEILAAIGPGREAPRSGTSVAATLAAALLFLDGFRR